MLTHDNLKKECTSKTCWYAVNPTNLLNRIYINKKKKKKKTKKQKTKTKNKINPPQKHSNISTNKIYYFLADIIHLYDLVVPYSDLTTTQQEIYEGTYGNCDCKVEVKN